MDTLTEWVVLYGPGVVFVLAVLETSFVTGLVVPSGMTAAAAAAIAVDDPVAISHVALAAVAGGFVGDLIGYWIGRRAGPTMIESHTWVGATLRRHERTAGRLLGRTPLFSVTLARLVSFVRTLMPLSAGMTRIPPITYILYEVPGLLAWAALYVGIGVVAGESWQVVSGAVGAGWIAIFAVAAAVVWMRNRRSTGRAPGKESE